MIVAGNRVRILRTHRKVWLDIPHGESILPAGIIVDVVSNVEHTDSSPAFFLVEYADIFWRLQLFEENFAWEKVSKDPDDMSLNISELLKSFRVGLEGQPRV